MDADNVSCIVPDSTLSSSPSPIVKRSARTYGRPKPSESTALASFAPESEPSSSSHQSIYKTAPHDLDEEIPPSSSMADPESDHEHLDGTDDEHEIDASPKFTFSWKAKLKAMDEQEDFDVDLPTIPGGGDASSLHQKVDDTSSPCQRPENDTRPNSPMDMNRRLSHQIEFGSSVPILTDPSSQPRPAAESRSPSPASPVVAHTRRRVPKRTTVIHDSDSDGAQKSSTKTSPLYPIISPKLHSSPTPPTSDDDELPTSVLSNSKGKGKATPSPLGRIIPPLRFDDLSPGTSNRKASGKITRSAKSKSRVKEPSKKEVLETARARHRIAADQHVSIPRAEQPNQKYSIGNFFALLKAKIPITKAPSSPIQEFSSSPALSFGPAVGLGAPAAPVTRGESPSGGHVRSPHATPPPSSHRQLLRPLDSDSDELPQPGELWKDKKESAAEERLQKLKEFKQRKLALMQKMETTAMSEDSDEEEDLLIVDEGDADMHAVAREEAEDRKARKKMHVRPSEGRKRQLMYGGVSLGKQKQKQKQEASPLKKAKEEDISASMFANGRMGEARDLSSMKELNKLLAKKVEEDNIAMTKKKEEEWVRRGGKLRPDIGNTTGEQAGEADGSVQDVLKVYAERALKVEEEKEGDVDMDDDDEDDDDRNPDTRGSVSPSRPSGENGSGSEVNEDADTTLVVPEDDDASDLQSDGELDDKENLVPHPPRRSRAAIFIDSDSDAENIPRPRRRSIYGKGHSVDLDDDKDEGVGSNMIPPLRLPGMMHRGSLSSIDEPTEDEGDKENNTRLMFDRSEDKENKAVVRHAVRSPLSGTVKGTLFDLEEGMRRAMSMSPRRIEYSDDAADIDENSNVAPNVEGAAGRKPLVELLGDEDPFESHPIGPASFPSGSQHRSPSSSSRSQRSPTLTLAPRFGDNYGAGKVGFSQFDDEGEGSADDRSSFVLKPYSLRQGLSDSFDSETQQEVSPSSPRPIDVSKGNSELTDGKKATSILDRLRKQGNLNDLPLTLDVGLQPALEVSENLRRQADSIFEKEQAYVLEAATRKRNTKPELYVNDHGFLTQTRPDVSSPEIYRVLSPSQRANFLITQRPPDSATQRHPLRTLSLSDDLDFDVDDTPVPEVPRRRLIKRDASSPTRSSPSGSPSQKRPLNAFDLLARGAKEQVAKPKKRLEKSEFVEAEAQESDDDELLGFGFGKKKDEEGDEEDGEDLDKTLEGLVDDAEMDEKTKAIDLVLEKVKEHQEIDDRNLEKLHKDAVEGKLRVKRRNRGVGMDSSDEEDEDEEDRLRRIREKMHSKKRRIDGDNLEELGQNEETRAFYDAYQSNLVDDELMLQSEDVEMAEADANDDDDEPQETISAVDVEQMLRQAAREHQPYRSIDPHDVSWLDNNGSDDDETGPVPVRKISSKQLPAVRRRLAFDEEDEDRLENSMPQEESQKDRSRMQTWAKVESKSRNVGTGRSAVGAAVTGHSKAKTKSGGGSLRTAALSAASNSRPTEQRKSLKAAPSVLLGAMADRNARFEQR